jgi:hypothetical protein
LAFTLHDDIVRLVKTSEIITDVFGFLHGHVGEAIQDKLVISLNGEFSLKIRLDDGPTSSGTLYFLKSDHGFQPNVGGSTKSHTKIAVGFFISPSIGLNIPVDPFGKLRCSNGVLILLTPKFWQFRFFNL